MLHRSLACLVLLLLLPLATFAQTADVDSMAGQAEDESADREAVRQAVLDYVEGIYEVQPERIRRSVHPDLVKRGFYIPRGETDYQGAPMTFDELVDLAGKWNASGRLPADAPKEVVVFDVLDQTASAKLVAQWGIDYFHLARYDGRWQIINVLWQSHPPRTMAEGHGQ